MFAHRVFAIVSLLSHLVQRVLSLERYLSLIDKMSFNGYNWYMSLDL